MKFKELRKDYNIISVISILMAIFHIYTALFGTLTALWQRSIHLCFGMLTTFLLSTKKTNKKHVKFVSVVLGIVAIITVVYFLVDFEGVVQRFSRPNTSDFLIGLAILLLTLEFARRNAGNILPAIAIVFLLYALLGQIGRASCRERV